LRTSDSPRLSERSSRSERSEFRGGADIASIAGNPREAGASAGTPAPDGPGPGRALAGSARRAFARANRPRPERLHQHDVVLLLQVQRLDLQRDALADQVAERGERLRFLLEEQVDHVLRRDDAELARVELARLALDLAQDLVAHCARGLDLALALAGRAGFEQQVRQRLAGALARHLDQAERREAVDARLGAVAGQRLAQFLKHLLAVLATRHVDEIDDDDAAEVAHAQLARDRVRGLEVGAEDRVVEVAPADVAAG